MNRRTFLKAAGAGVLAGVGGLAGYGRWIEPGLIEVVEQQIALRRLGAGLNGLRVAQISDMHMGRWFTQPMLEAVVAQVIALKPDVVWLTGDYILQRQDPVESLRAFSGPIGELAKQAPIYGVLGNHDYYRRNNRLVHDTLDSLGIQDVTNSYSSYRRGGDTLYIAGVGTVSTGHMQLDRVARMVPKEEAVVLLAHEPDVAQWSALKPEFVFQASGHSHGGQICIPPIGPLYLPFMGELYPSGLYNVSGMPLYTNRGLGMTHYPIRINCVPEITVLTLGQSVD